MNQLFRRVCEGRIVPIPGNYSKDLMHMIKLCLQVDPKLRPGCGDMLTKSQLVRNQPSQLALAVDNQEGFTLIGTIRVPRNLAQVTDRLPASQYDSEQGGGRLNRNSSLPAIRPSDAGKEPMSLRPASKARGGSLAPIKERDEYIRSADPSVSASRKMAAAAAARQMAPAQNRPSGYKATNTGDERQAAQQLPPRQARNGGRNPAVAQHRSPVIPSGKEQL